mmetsp:Transcript_19885/g.37076  ORF Transcript_19885/g.37076 Transcript_19885/m.37076 type:complete len:112 (-) Transcript_19885:175-510(-)
MNFSSQKQTIKPPLRGIFPLDHDAECSSPLKSYLSCLKSHSNEHSKCREGSKEYLKCRMSNGLMKEEELDDLGYKNKVIRDENEGEAERAKETKGFVAGKHIKSRKQSWLW